MTTKDHTAALRERFEAWFRENYHARLDRNMPDRSYNDPTAHMMWTAVAALAKPQQPAGWRPIETVPKDGSEVLLWLGAPWSKVEKARWYAPWSNWQCGTIPADPVREEYHGIGQAIPTHWMPLPAPPVAHPSQQEDGPLPDICPRCDGSGEETVMSDNSPDAHEVQIDCTHCKGNGGLLDAYNGVVETLKMERAAHLWAAGERLLQAAQSQQEDDERSAAAEIVRWRSFTGQDCWDIKVFDRSLANGTKLYVRAQNSAGEGGKNG